MEIKVLGTGSSGNCYALKAGGKDGQILLLDAGLPAIKIVRKIQGSNWNWIQTVGCLITHEHGDHCTGAQGIANLGVKTYATAGTIEAAHLNVGLTRLNAVQMLSSFDIGDFTVMPFETQHDAKEPCGWLIRFNPTGEIAVYATDTYYLKQTFPGVNYWIVECNYVEEIMNAQQEDGELEPELRNRLMKSHMSLRRLCDALKANDLRYTRAILLVHLSDERSDEQRMVESVKRVADIEDVWAAEAGKTYQMNLLPF